MTKDSLKQQIRRRVFAEDFRLGRADQSLVAEFFAVCTECKGHGKIGFDTAEEDYVAAGSYECDFCEGAGFVEVRQK